MAPEVIGPWRVVGALGAGGFAQVHRAARADGPAEAALKRGLERGGSRFGTRLLGAAHARAVIAGQDEPRSVGPEEVDALLRAEGDLLEAAAGAAGLPRLLERLEHAGRVALALELVPGEPLLARRARGAPLPLAPVAALARRLAAAIRAGLLVAHGDLKLDNLLLDEGAAPEVALRPIDPGAAAGGRTALTPEYSPLLQRGAGADALCLAGVVYAYAAGRAPFGEPAPLSARRGDRVALGAFHAVAHTPLEGPPALARTLAALLSCDALTGADDPARLDALAAELDALIAGGLAQVTPPAPAPGVAGPPPIRSSPPPG